MTDELQCTYCERFSDEEDHVPPRTLFPKPRPANLVEVPSCSECNRLASTDDEYFRTFVGLRSDVEDTVEGRNLMPAIERSAKRGRGPILSVLESARSVERRSRAGIILSPGVAFDCDLNRLDKVVERTVAGLYLDHYGERLYPTHIVRSFCLDGLRNLSSATRANVEKSVAEVLKRRPTEIGGNVFSILAHALW